MGDITVDSFQETLKQLITRSKLGLTIGEKRQLQSLQKEIECLRGFLKVTEKKRNDHSKVMEHVMQIRDVVFEAENIIDLFVGRDFKRPNAYQYLDHPSLDFESVKKKIKTLMAKVKQIYDMKMYDINEEAVKIPKRSSTGSEGGAGSSGGSNTSKLVKENVVVGFKEQVNRVIAKLDDRGEGRPLEIITIIGAGGGGKTTLAREVYNHPLTMYTFEIRAWVDVSQDYNKTMKRDLLIRILELASLGKRADYEKSSEDKLGEDVYKCLKGRKYLIVMDDIWGIEAWNDMQRSFPKECKGSKVLFTSRLVVQLDTISYVPHCLDPLPKNSSWELLQNKTIERDRERANQRRRENEEREPDNAKNANQKSSTSTKIPVISLNKPNPSGFRRLKPNERRGEEDRRRTKIHHRGRMKQWTAIEARQRTKRRRRPKTNEDLPRTNDEEQRSSTGDQCPSTEDERRRTKRRKRTKKLD